MKTFRHCDLVSILSTREECIHTFDPEPATTRRCLCVVTYHWFLGKVQLVSSTTLILIRFISKETGVWIKTPIWMLALPTKLIDVMSFTPLELLQNKWEFRKAFSKLDFLNHRKGNKRLNSKQNKMRNHSWPPWEKVTNISRVNQLHCAWDSRHNHSYFFNSTCIQQNVLLLDTDAGCMCWVMRYEVRNKSRQVDGSSNYKWGGVDR